MEKPAKNGITYQFGEFRLDSAQRLIFRAGRPVPLAPKVIETLLALVEHGGTLVTKDELMARVWPDTFVEESNLTQNIFQLRKVLGEGQNGTNYIETVPRRGYRFMGEIKPLIEDGVELILTNRTRTHIVHEEETTDRESDAQAAPSAGNQPQAPARRARLFVPVVVVALLLVAGGLGLRRFIGQRRSQAIPATPAAAIQLKRLTYDSKAFGPAVSPSGEYVAYRFHEGDKDSLRLKNIANGSTIQISLNALRHHILEYFDTDAMAE